MSRLATGLAVLAVALLAGCVVTVAPAVDGGTTPGDAELSFSNATASVGFAYESVEGGSGNGNDGLYVADYDGDLREDVLAIGGEAPVLFENTGDGFERSGALPNVSSPRSPHVQSALWLDRDNDGHRDLVLFRQNGTPVFLENLGGRFERVDAGLDDRFANPVGATTADYDGDGCLDLFVIQYGRWDETTPRGWNEATVEDDNGYPNALYRGSCGGGFERAADAGVGPGESGPHWSLATSFVDLNGDGHPDVHVANDYYNDTVYVNDGDGTFTRLVLGAATDRNGMSSEVVDLAGDARPELFVTNIFFPRERIAELPPLDRRLFSNFLSNRLGKRVEGNTLLEPTGDGYRDVADEVGLSDGGWGWAAVASDLDSDGQQDVFHTTQPVVTFDQANPLYPLPMVWVQQDGAFYRQDADEIGFEITDGRGAVGLDYDVDGAVDLGVATYGDRYRFYENEAEQGNSLQVLVEGGDGRVDVGATVTAIQRDGAHVSPDDARHFFATAESDYQSQDSRVVHVGLGERERVDELRIVWPDGTERTFEDVAAGQRIRVTPAGIQERIEYVD